MIVSSPSSFSDLLVTRVLNLNNIAEDLSCYGPDRQPMIRATLLQEAILDPLLPEIVLSLYIKAKDSQAPISENEDYKRYREVLSRLTNYVKLKKEHAEPNNVINSDIWMRAIPQAPDENHAKSLLKASDRIEDFIWLADLASSMELPEEFLHLEEEIKKLLAELHNDVDKFPAAEDLVESIKVILGDIQQFYLTHNKGEMTQKILQLKKIVLAYNGESIQSINPTSSHKIRSFKLAKKLHF
ncbi:MAG: hypothetical protein ACHQUC_01515 [Chlamydiales bacterium]